MLAKTVGAVAAPHDSTTEGVGRVAAAIFLRAGGLAPSHGMTFNFESREGEVPVPLAALGRVKLLLENLGRYGTISES
jgi:hypothetical protein